jgi:hypothetical protein
MGWDSLHPEFNYQLAFERVFSGAWRESQGLGDVAVHSHMSELPRIAVLWVIDLFVSTSAVRWTYILLMLVLGVIGSYVLLVNILSRLRIKIGMEWVTIVAIVGSLAYLFNLSTLHHFIVPFEMFVVLFGLLPWSLWSASRYFEVPNKLRLIVLILIQFLLSPIAFAATLWVVYWGVFILTTWFLAGKKRQWIKVQILTLMVNSYWLLPTMYGLVTAGGVVESAKINQVFSPEAWLNNVAYGSVQQVARLESFILQWMNYDFGSNKFDLVASQWLNGVNQNYVWMTLNIVTGLVGVGILRWMYMSVISKNRMSRRWSGIILAGFILFIIMLSQMWPISIGIEWAREKLPLLGELLRTPFTKVSIFLQLIYAVLVATGLLWVVDKVRFNFVRWVVVIVAAGVIIFPFTAWILKGNLMGSAVVTKMPEEYLKLFEVMKSMGDGRVVSMPMPNMWGWEYRDWGYQGANFTQFGITQPLLIRDFDRWSPYNEGFYDEFSTAMYSCNPLRSTLGSDPPASASAGWALPLGSDPGEQGCESQIEKVLRKYDVRYVLLDESVIAPGQDKEILRIEQTKKLASELGWEEKFHEGFLTVWDTGERGDKFVSAPVSYTWVSGDTNKVRNDVVFDEVGTYVTTDRETGAQENRNAIYYPFANLMREEVKNVLYGENSVQLTTSGVQGQELVIPGWKAGEMVEMGYEVKVESGKLQVEWEPVYRVGEQEGPKLGSSQYPVSSINGGVWVQVGDSEAKYIKPDEVAKGRAKLRVGEPIEIRVYQGQGEEVEVKVGEVQKCGEQGEYRCWATPLTIATKDSLVQTITHYEGGSSPEVCLDLEGEPYECVNAKRRGESPVVVTTAVNKGERYWLDWVAKDTTTKLNQPGVVVYKLSNQFTVGSDQWGEFEKQQEYGIGGNRIIVEVTGTPITYDFGKEGKTEIKNCDVLNRGFATKSQPSNPVGSDPPAVESAGWAHPLGSDPGVQSRGASYIADERGAVCDYVEMSELDVRLPYLMRLKGENKEGRSLKFFLWNTGSKKNDIEYLLGKDKFDQTFSLLPWNWDGAYTLNIETRSFGQRAENTIGPVEVRWFPLEQIARSRILSTDGETPPSFGVPTRDSLGSPIEESPQTRSDLRVTEVKKTGTWLYRVRVEGTGLLKLSQGYDEGWVGVGVDHVKVDGWANGWIVDKCTPISKCTQMYTNGGQEAQRIIILYWPQLLEYLGFALLGITLIFLLKKST